MDIRRFIIIFVIAILYAIFAASVIDAIYPAPEYPRDCGQPAPMRLGTVEKECSPVVASPEEQQTCSAQNGDLTPVYDANGCAASFTCSTCRADYEAANKDRALVAFSLAAFLGIIAIVSGLFLPVENPLNEWVGFGFILGGLFTIFWGTAGYYHDMSRILRPIVMFIELCLVIFVAYRKINLRPTKKK